MISLDVYPDSPSLSFNKINLVDDFVRCLSRFPSLSLFIKSTMLMISSYVYADSPPSLSLFIKSTMLMVSLDVYPDSPLSVFLVKSTMLMISLDVYPDSPLSLF